MRVLFVVARVPGADFKGDQVRSFQQISHLAARHRITLISLDTPAKPSHLPAQIRELCEEVIIVRLPLWRSMLTAIRAVFSGRPFQVEAYHDARIEAAVERCLAAKRFDLVHLQVARLGWLGEQRTSPPGVIDLVDALSLNMKRRAQHDRGPMAWIAAIEARRMHRYEQRLLGRMAAAAVSSPIDLEALGAPANLHQVDNGVDPVRFTFSSPRNRELAIVFVGNLGYFPNVDAVLWFAANALPLIRERFPEVALRLVGARPDPALQRLAELDPRTTLVGPVADTLPYLANAAVAIAPMRAGSGQQLKVLEAMAAGTPVVLTPAVAASIEANAEEHFLVADSAQDTADAVCRLLVDPDLRVRIAEAARKRVVEHYTWHHSAERMERVWLSAVSAGPRTSGS